MMILTSQTRSMMFAHSSLYSSCNQLHRLFSSDSHDDFKPKAKAPTGSVDVSALELIQKDISSNDVFIYMKGVPDAPNCGFSNVACRILDAYGVKYGSRNVLADASVREEIKKFSSWPTIPQIFVKGEFIGGCDILMDMQKSGDLDKLLAPLAKK